MKMVKTKMKLSKFFHPTNEPASLKLSPKGIFVVFTLGWYARLYAPERAFDFTFILMILFALYSFTTIPDKENIEPNDIMNAKQLVLLTKIRPLLTGILVVLLVLGIATSIWR
jgi:hypothetical protein